MVDMEEQGEAGGHRLHTGCKERQETMGFISGNKGRQVAMGWTRKNRGKQGSMGCTWGCSGK